MIQKNIGVAIQTNPEKYGQNKTTIFPIFFQSIAFDRKIRYNNKTPFVPVPEITFAFLYAHMVY